MVAHLLRLKLALLRNGLRSGPWQVVGLVLAAAYGLGVLVLGGCASSGSESAAPSAPSSSPVKTLTMLPAPEKTLSGELTAELEEYVRKNKRLSNALTRVYRQATPMRKG